jgi:hypothetical protein
MPEPNTLTAINHNQVKRKNEGNEAGSGRERRPQPRKKKEKSHNQGRMLLFNAQGFSSPKTLGKIYNRRKGITANTQGFYRPAQASYKHFSHPGSFLFFFVQCNSQTQASHRHGIGVGFQNANRTPIRPIEIHGGRETQSDTDKKGNVLLNPTQKLQAIRPFINTAKRRNAFIESSKYAENTHMQQYGSRVPREYNVLSSILKPDKFNGKNIIL